MDIGGRIAYLMAACPDFLVGCRIGRELLKDRMSIKESYVNVNNKIVSFFLYSNETQY